MLIGEAPGREEDRTGRPFAGVSGKTLDRVLEEAGWKRKDLFITSVVKCRPPHNRIPKKDEQDTCIEMFLHRQIELIKPKMVCLLGGVAGRAFLDVGRIADSRGRLIRKGQTNFFLTYHPAAARRNPKWYQLFLDDLATLRSILGRAPLP
jgi:DNA polymerase